MSGKADSSSTPGVTNQGSRCYLPNMNPNRHLKLLLITLATSAVWSSCRNPVAPEPPKPSYFISPDTVHVNVYDGCAFTMRSSDSAWQAYKYLWDFGDGGEPVSVQGHNSTYHTYSQNDSYQVSASALDSNGHIIADAKAIAIVGIPYATLSITPQSDTINSLTSTFFKASTSTSLPVTYSWDFGDGSAPLADRGDTISHDYLQDGIYRVIATAQYRGYAIGSDTVLETVALPTTTCATLCGMLSVTSSFSQNGSEWFEFTLPLTNEGDYSFSLTGRTFLDTYIHQSHVLSGGKTVDSFKKESIGGMLSPDGRYLLRTASNHFDSTYTATAAKLTGDALQIGYTADSLRLVSACLDSIVFSTSCRANGQWTGREAHWAYDKICQIYESDMIQWHRVCPSAFGQVRIVFRRIR
jgi:PKD repeat protein